jgi:2-oxoglutarate dehydrogenase E1 component
MSGTAGGYVEDMYAAYRADPSSVHSSWRAYFRNLDAGVTPNIAFTLPTGVGKMKTSSTAQDIEDHMKVQLLIRAYQTRGHLKAKIDPLGILQPDRDISPAPELEPSYYGFGESDMERTFQLGTGVLPAFRRDRATMTLSEILRTLQGIYCKSIGYEYTHIPDRAQCDWLRARIEVAQPYKFDAEEKKRILDRLTWADAFERFVASKWPGEKRFGLEGAESLIPGLKALIDRVVDTAGAEHVVMGMAHRGRLNVLTNVVRKPVESVFCEFSGALGGDTSAFSGDVKYHLGMNYVRPTPSGKRVNLSLVANPSHLEAVDPVVLGKTRALQFFLGDSTKAVPLLIHGDAAFAGQGVVYETMGLSELPSYSTEGTVHVIVNNQIGFTTDPRFSRSTPYCSDLAKTIAAPIIHVNGDDVEAVVHSFLLAADWRAAFKTDVVVDLVCYRKHGHNEVDQPSFTQPRMYAAIAKKTSIHDLYVAQLEAEGGVTKEEIGATRDTVWGKLEEAYAASKTYVPTSKEWLTSNWNGFMSPKELQEKVAPYRPTGVELETLKRVGIASASYPEGFEVHPGLKRIMEGRRATIEKGEDVDMPTAEALAFGTLMLEGNHVRLSGQDVERGTFSQRHSVLHNQNGKEERYVPLAHIAPNQAPFSVCNSSLSEYGVLGFELGYSLVSPHALTIWEAQFGDFANGAQVMIDQFIASGERKWLQRSALTLNLPHGYDGAGPEHSNGRIERFLSLCDDNPYRPVPSDESDTRTRQAQDCNLQIVYPSTPANYFHVLRRQLHRDFRKPLVLFNSKALLRHPMARSTLAEMAPGTRFRKLIPESYPRDLHAPEKIKRVVFCSGQIYYALLRARQANGIKDVAIARVEQLSPFPYDQFVRECDFYPHATEIVWAQEEPLNLGMWTYVEPRIESVLVKASKWHAGRRARYAGREPTAAVATGHKKQHVAEEFALIGEALLGRSEKPKNVENGSPIW